ncbi:MAG: hypothetical protein GX846_07320 [Deltaproteobacteria bacterium]|nr:hypothetical protein [Deltaproteobacteria bacterium]
MTDKMLDRLAQQRPRSPHYLERGRRGGTMATRWNLIIPDTLAGLGEPDEH